MNPSQTEVRPDASLRRLVLHLPTSAVPEGDPAYFDMERFAATLKRSHVEIVIFVTSAPHSEPPAPSSSESSEENLQSHLERVCPLQGLAIEFVDSTEQEAGIALTDFPSRPALEAFCYSRICRGRPPILEDCLSPAGTFDEEAYRLLGVVFSEIALKEGWCRGARPCVEIGVVSSTPASESTCGAARILQAGGHGFALVETTADFTPYRVLILPEDIPCDSDLKAGVEAYLQQGGSVLATFDSHEAAEQSGYEVTGEARVLPGYGLIATRIGGDSAFLGEPHFRAYAQSAATRHKRIVLEALNRLLPDPLLRHDGPGTLEAILTEQTAYNRWVLHLLHYLPIGLALDSPVRDDVLPVHEVKISLKAPKPIKRVMLRPQYHDELEFWEHQGRVEFVVPKITGHRMVSIEFMEEAAQ